MDLLTSLWQESDCDRPACKNRAGPARLEDTRETDGTGCRESRPLRVRNATGRSEKDTAQGLHPVPGKSLLCRHGHLQAQWATAGRPTSGKTISCDSRLPQPKIPHFVYICKNFFMKILQRKTGNFSSNYAQLQIRAAYLATAAVFHRFHQPVFPRTAVEGGIRQSTFFQRV